MPITFAQPGSTRIYEIRGSLIVSVRSHTRPIPPGELLSVGISVSSGRRASTLPRPGFRLPCRATRLPALPSSLVSSGERLARSPHDASTPVCRRRSPASGFGAHYCTPMWLVCHWRDLANMQRSCTLCWLDVRSSKDPGGSKLPGPTSSAALAAVVFFWLAASCSGNGWRRMVEAQA